MISLRVAAESDLMIAQFNVTPILAILRCSLRGKHNVRLNCLKRPKKMPSPCKLSCWEKLSEFFFFHCEKSWWITITLVTNKISRCSCFVNDSSGSARILFNLKNADLRSKLYRHPARIFFFKRFFTILVHVCDSPNRALENSLKFNENTKVHFGVFFYEKKYRLIKQTHTTR